MVEIKIGIIRNKENANSSLIEKELVDAIVNKGKNPIYGDDDRVYKESDIIISIGGDGTFLQVASKAIKYATPVIGINLGILGFLTEIDKEDIKETIERLVTGAYIVEKRRLLRVDLERKGSLVYSDIGMNDCVIAREILASLLYLNIYINDHFLDTYPGDGLVIATQTGSTAYSLSLGGPIVEPGNDLLVFTPLNPHMVDNRSIVLGKDSEIMVEVCRDNKASYVICDGHSSFKIEKGDIIRCRLIDKSVSIIRIDPPNFYDVLKQKNEERRKRFCDK